MFLKKCRYPWRAPTRAHRITRTHNRTDAQVVTSEWYIFSDLFHLCRNFDPGRLKETPAFLVRSACRASETCLKKTCFELSTHPNFFEAVNAATFLAHSTRILAEAEEKKLGRKFLKILGPRSHGPINGHLRSDASSRRSSRTPGPHKSPRERRRCFRGSGAWIFRRTV